VRQRVNALPPGSQCTEGMETFCAPSIKFRRGRLLFVNKKKQKNFMNFGRAGGRATGHRLGQK
jgi:hypothetical protein